jgi:signal transduction histidine kinase/ligand-binding sensor domain-containing protein
MRDRVFARHLQLPVVDATGNRSLISPKPRAVAQNGMTIVKCAHELVRTCIIGLTCVGLSLLRFPEAKALNPAAEASQYAHQSWKIRDGFLKGIIYAIAQTSDGYLWLGTESGLFYFDGVRNVAWQAPPDQHLPSDHIWTLLGARDGTLWIGTAAGLASWKDGKLTQFARLSGRNIYALVEDHEGTIWVGASLVPTGELCAIRKSAVQCYGENDAFGRGVVQFRLYADKKNNLWVGTRKGLWRWKPGPRQFYPLTSEPYGIRSFVEADDASLLIGVNTGVMQLTQGKIGSYLSRVDGQRFQVDSLLRDRDGCLWIAASGHGLIHLHQGKTDVFTQTDGLTSDTITALFEDREGDIWVASSDGLDRFRDFAVTTITTKQGLSNVFTGSVLAARDGSIWLSTSNGLDKITREHIAVQRVVSDSRNGKLSELASGPLFQDSQGRIWVSTHGEIGYLERDRFVFVTYVTDPLCFAEDSEGALWVADHIGLVRIREGEEIKRISWIDLGHKDFAVVITADPRHGGLWIGYRLGGVAYFKDGRLRASYEQRDGLGGSRVDDLQVDTDGALWVATNDGLSRVKDGRIATLTTRDGLPCNIVHWSMAANDGALWLYTACGLVRIARPEIDNWVAVHDRHKTDSGTTSKAGAHGDAVHITVLDNLDGVLSHSTRGWFNPQAVKSSDGQLWFLPWGGVGFLDPLHIPFNSMPPPVHIERIVADGKEYEVSNGLRLPPHVRDLMIDYTALSLVAPEKVRFRLKLEGQDPDWREVVNDREVQYSNLKPRRYTFRVIACNNSGVWNEAGAVLEFSIAPAYYQTTWFKILCAFVFVTLLGLLHRLRLHQMQQRYVVVLEASVSERLRIARELHDTLLQSIQALMVQIQAARNMVPRKPEDAVHALDDAIAETAKAVAEGRDAIRDLRPDPVAQRDLADLLNATGRELANAEKKNGATPSFQLVVEGEQRALSPTLQDEVYRIAREATRNAFRHASASHIEAEIHYDSDHLRLRIRDDGKGIDSEMLAAGGRPGHWGIPGIRERARRIGARLDFWTEKEAGTEVELRVPAAIAYDKRRNGNRFRLFSRTDGDERRS